MTLASVLPLTTHSHHGDHEDHSHGAELPGLHQQGHDCDGMLASDGLIVPERWRGLRYAIPNCTSEGTLASESLASTSYRLSTIDLTFTDGVSLRAHCQVFLL